MRVSSNITALALLAATSLACDPSKLSRSDSNSTNEYPKTILGPEGSVPGTLGYTLNHLALNVRNVTRSIDFYSQVFGMRLMFTIQASKHYSISYMGYSQGGKNGTGYQTTEELIFNQHNTQGLLELLSYDAPGADDRIWTNTAATRFNHGGFVVPNVNDTQARLEHYGVEIYKKIGAPFPRDGPVAAAFRVSEIGDEEYQGLIPIINAVTSGLLFAADPDGNILEILGPDAAIA